MFKRSVMAVLMLAGPAYASPPVAPVVPYVTDYWGTNVTDNYRWMEDTGSPLFKSYVKGQGDYTRQKLDSIPGRAQLLKEIAVDSNLSSYSDALILMAGKEFFTQIRPGQNTLKLYVRDEGTGAEKMLIDPDRYGKPGQAEAINFFQPSMDGKYVAYGISEGGSEADTLRVMDVATGADEGVAITRVDGDNDDFLPVWWLPDDSFAYYREQFLGPKDDPDAVFLKSRTYLHQLGHNGNGEGDKVVFGYGVDLNIPIAADQDSLIETMPGSLYAFAVNTENESDDEIDAIYVSPVADLEKGSPVWTKVVTKGDGVTGFDAEGDIIFLLTHKDAPQYKVLATSLSHPDFDHAVAVVPETDKVIQYIAAASDALYVDSFKAGFNTVTRLPLADGKVGTAQIFALPYAGAVNTLVANEAEPGAVLTLESWTKSALWYKYDAATGRLTDTGLQKPLGLDTSDLISKEVMATSYDGTEVPLSIIMRKDMKLDGKTPTWLIGYGAYGITLSPGFDPSYMPWLDRGGILAFAHVRGGGWNGEAWHQAGMKLTKLNTVFDFIACAQYLVDEKYTSPAHLAGEGGSAGGITIGGAITWRPDMFAAAVDSHGDTDSLRMEFTPNGPPNISEFGSVTTQAGFHGLYAMSAYEHVRDGVKYPAVLLVTGANDPRVAPWAVTKMTARLQAASSSGKPVLLSYEPDSGHGIGDTRAQYEGNLADEMSFFLWQFGERGFQPGK